MDNNPIWRYLLTIVFISIGSKFSKYIDDFEDRLECLAVWTIAYIYLFHLTFFE